jgi:hypothetical protein
MEENPGSAVTNIRQRYFGYWDGGGIQKYLLLLLDLL